MATIVSVHSFRGGTGKSNTTANIAAVLSARGSRVGVIDTDIQSPGVHIVFGLSDDETTSSLNDYLWEGREIGQAAHDVTPQANGDGEAASSSSPRARSPARSAARCAKAMTRSD